VSDRVFDNAFFKAILPGFDREVTRARHGQPPDETRVLPLAALTLTQIAAVSLGLREGPCCVASMLGLNILLVALVFFLATYMPGWVAALVVGAVLLLIDGFSPIVKKPERVAAKPIALTEILTAAANAAVAIGIKKVLERGLERVLNRSVSRRPSLVEARDPKSDVTWVP
jgi:hypothetical protein